MTTSALPVPPFATEGTFNGGFETRIDQAVIKIYDSLEGRYSRFQVGNSGDILRLDDGVTWPQVEAFYDSTFAQPPLDSFVRQQQIVSMQPERYRLAVWENDGVVLGVAMVPGQPDDPIPFLLRIGSVAK